MTDKLSQTQVITGAVVLAVLAGLLGFWLGSRYSGALPLSETPGTSNGVTPPGAPSGVGSGSNAVSARDVPAGQSVLISAVSLSEPGWVVVHDVQGKPGWVLGAQWLQAGDYQNVAVTLLRATEAGKEYSVMLHADNGNRTYEIREDLPLTPMVAATFTATAAQ